MPSHRTGLEDSVATLTFNIQGFDSDAVYNSPMRRSQQRTSGSFSESQMATPYPRPSAASHVAPPSPSLSSFTPGAGGEIGGGGGFDVRAGGASGLPGSGAVNHGTTLELGSADEEASSQPFSAPSSSRPGTAHSDRSDSALSEAEEAMVTKGIEGCDAVTADACTCATGKH